MRLLRTSEWVLSRKQLLSNLSQLAYRRLALENHPDRTGRATDDLFREVQEAYSVLSDPMRKQEYDWTSRFSNLSNTDPAAAQAVMLAPLAILIGAVYLAFKLSDFIPLIFLLLLAINARKMGRSVALPLTLILLSFTSGFVFVVVWTLCMVGRIDEMEWLFWGVAYSSLFNHYNAVSVLVALTWTIEQTRLGQRLINLSPVLVVLKLFIHIFI